jgi:outer membrane murein-binding lipoprotein Lpp
MIRQRTVWLFLFAIVLLCLGTLSLNGRQASFASQPVPAAEEDKDALAGQIKELQKQVAELQSQVRDLKTPRIVAAGTATVRIGPRQDNKNSVRVKLPGDIVASLGDNYIVELTNRYPTGGSFFVAYWKKATDGFDILLADPSLEGIELNPNRTEPYFIDWIVVRK